MVSRNAAHVAGVIVARTDSSRLPRKALLEVAGRPLIDYVVERARRAPSLSTIALATTDRSLDDDLAQHGALLGLPVYRGSVEDVVMRFLSCAEMLGADYAVRMNADSPFLDPSLVTRGLELVAGDVDLVTNLPGRTFPYGISVEIVRVGALVEAHASMDPSEREHVTQHFYAHSDRFSLRTIASDQPGLSRARMTIDTADDLSVFERVVSELGPDALTAGFATVATRYIELGHTREAPYNE